ncbi:hypothetical protein BKA66DRAFT_454245 [Pyrenochaeta sp. MPI-SDFR-AT-0127]|nr:hypothetical protein BKA66DRAFT_454245 [Pyrenochaeta sp. MPI-SDFR-AT-0127]
MLAGLVLAFALSPCFSPGSPSVVRPVAVSKRCVSPLSSRYIPIISRSAQTVQSHAQTASAISTSLRTILWSLTLQLHHPFEPTPPT